MVLVQSRKCAFDEIHHRRHLLVYVYTTSSIGVILFSLSGVLNNVSLVFVRPRSAIMIISFVTITVIHTGSSQKPQERSLLVKDLKDLKDLKPPFVHAIRRLINLVLYLPRHAFLPIYIMKFTTAIFLTTYLVGASGKCGL